MYHRKLRALKKKISTFNYENLATLAVDHLREVATFWIMENIFPELVCQGLSQDNETVDS